MNMSFLYILNSHLIKETFSKSLVGLLSCPIKMEPDG